MCANHPKKTWKTSHSILIAIVLGIICVIFPNPYALSLAKAIQLIFQKLLKLIAVPIIFFSIFSIILKMSSKSDFKRLFKRSISYTFLTTFLAAFVALLLFSFVKTFSLKAASHSEKIHQKVQSFQILESIIPDHPFEPFMNGNVFSCLFLAILLGFAFTKVSDNRKIADFSNLILEALMKLAQTVMIGMPLVVFSSIILAFQTQQNLFGLSHLMLFLAVVVAANLIQGMIVLPIILKLKKVPILETFFGFKDALVFAFFSKSSLATIPIATELAERNLKIHPTISQFTFPIFTTINMNGCAAFIFTALSFGFFETFHQISSLQLLSCLIIAVIAAIGNAGVPMGCYFLSSALLSALDLDMNLIGLILPFYALIDMVETALNVWSDAVITTVVNKEFNLSFVN